MFLVFFFFSSRRRHTRSTRDWSSDVCSSDLPKRDRPAHAITLCADLPILGNRRLLVQPPDERLRIRSEERRVGKECRSRRLTQHNKKKTSSRNATMSIKNNQPRRQVNRRISQ